MHDVNEQRRQYLEALRRAEGLAEELARAACNAAASGRDGDLEVARMALESHRRAKDLREQAQAEILRLMERES